MKTLRARIERLERLYAADRAAHEPSELLFTPEERARRLRALLDDYIERGYLVISDAGKLETGENLPGPSRERSIALFLVVAVDLATDPAKQEEVKICE